MNENLEALGLDSTRIQIQRDVSTSIGEIYISKAESRRREQEWQMDYYAAATNFRRAAANSLLLRETEQARRLFHAAALAYAKAGSAYGVFLENLGEEDVDELPISEQRPRNGQDIFLLLGPKSIRNGLFRQTEQSAKHRLELEDYRSQRVGVLGIQVEVYLEIYDSLTLATVEDESAMLRQAILPLIASYANALRQCRRDRYHWNRMATPFHPIEPDVMAVMVGLDRALAERRSSLTNMIADLPLRTDARQLLNDTILQYRIWGTDENSN